MYWDGVHVLRWCPCWLSYYVQDRVPVKGGRGTVHLVIKCKLCARENTVGEEHTHAPCSLVTPTHFFGNLKHTRRDSRGPHQTLQSECSISCARVLWGGCSQAVDSGVFKAIVAFNCRGVEISAFDPRVRSSVCCYGDDVLLTGWLPCERREQCLQWCLIIW